MFKNPYLSIFLSIAASIAPLFFSWPYTLMLSILAAVFFPPIAIFTGLLLDLSYAGHAGIPYFTILGCGIAVAGAFVHQFLKTRIMS